VCKNIFIEAPTMGRNVVSYVLSAMTVLWDVTTRRRGHAFSKTKLAKERLIWARSWMNMTGMKSFAGCDH